MWNLETLGAVLCPGRVCIPAPPLLPAVRKWTTLPQAPTATVFRLSTQGQTTLQHRETIDTFLPEVTPVRCLIAVTLQQPATPPPHAVRLITVSFATLPSPSSKCKLIHSSSSQCTHFNYSHSSPRCVMSHKNTFSQLWMKYWGLYGKQFFYGA